MTLIIKPFPAYRGTGIRLATLITSAVLASGLIAAPQAWAAAPAAVLMVDDRLVVGILGDEQLSLAEAIEVAAGTRPASDLSPAERQHITGDPTTAGRRVISVTLGRGSVIEADGPIPVLRGLEDMVLDGGGAALTATDDAKGTAFAVASSQLTIRDMGILGFDTGVSILPQGIRDISQVSLEDLDISAGSFGINISASTEAGSIGTVRDITISGGRIQGLSGATTEALTGINIVGQSSATPGVVDGVSIVDNWFGSNLWERIHLVGVQGLGTTSVVAPLATESQLRNVTVARNTFTECADPCVLVYGALALAGQVSNASVTGIRIVDNVMPVGAHDATLPVSGGVGVLLLGGYTLVPGATDNNSITDVLIRGNTIYPHGSAIGRCTGIGLVGDWTDFHIGDATDGRIERAVIADNDVTGCDRGLLLTGAFSWEEIGGTIRDSSVSEVTVTDNRFHSNTTGIHISGAVMDYTRLWGRAPTTFHAAGQVLTGNSVRRIALTKNELLGNTTALLVTGASVIDTNGHVVTGNLAEDVSQRDNVYRYNQRDCQMIDNHSENSVGVNRDNLVISNPCQ